MRGRIEDSIKEERVLLEKIKVLPDYIQDYYYYLGEKTCATKRVYINSIIRFLTWFGNGNIHTVSESDFEDITPRIIQRYMSEIKYYDNNKEMSDSARANEYCYINAFTTFLKYNNIISDNPFDGKRIQRPKLQDNDIIFLEPEEYSTVKKNIMEGVGNARAKALQKKWMYRDLLLFQLPIITGVRVTALSQISISDIDFDRKYISVIDKAREKKLFLDDETIGMIYVWLKNRDELIKGHADNGYLFISNRRDKMDVTSIRDIIKKYTYNIDKHITPHKLRSTCATNMYRATRDIYIVAETLGHKSPATTRKYAMVDNNDRMNATEMLAKQMKGIN